MRHAHLLDTFSWELKNRNDWDFRLDCNRQYTIRENAIMQGAWNDIAFKNKSRTYFSSPLPLALTLSSRPK